MKRIFGLDLIRSIAILSVLLCHYLDVFYHFTTGKLEIFFNFSIYILGYYGVEIFFVLSGYLIGSIFLKTIVFQPEKGLMFSKLSNFLMKRWFRTLPNYFLYILIYLFVYYYINNMYYKGNVFKFVFFLQAIDYKVNLDFFGVSWSLAVEEWFYFSIALFFLISTLFITNLKSAFLLSLSIIFIFPLGLKVIYVLTEPLILDHINAFKYATFFRLDSIGFGVLFAWLIANNRYNKLFANKRTPLFFLGLFIISISLIYAYLFLAKNQQISILYLFFAPICDLGIVLCFPFFIGLKEFRVRGVNKFIIFVSLSSYSLYLCHLPIKQLFEYTYGNNVWFKTSISGAFLKFFVLISISFFWSILNYRFFEEPILRLRARIEKKFLQNN